MAHVDTSKHPPYPERPSAQLEQLSASIRSHLECGSVSDLADALKHVQQIAELTVGLQSSIKNRLDDRKFFSDRM